MKLIYNHRDAVIRFGVEQIKKALERKGVYFIEQFDGQGTVVLPENGIIVRVMHVARNKTPLYEKEAFRIYCSGKRVHIAAFPKEAETAEKMR